MKHTKKRISKIANELIIYFFNMGATDITANLQDKKDYYRILLRSNFTTKDTDKMEKIEKMVKYLKLNKQEEMEEYYWELIGECDVDTELPLVGMMIDDVETHINDDTIEVILYKYK
ncbi:MAG: hypothetical protein MJB12_06640, partial [Firmicutes bacterium]|nr:hypothetical protein [Bacillota bacterium]